MNREIITAIKERMKEELLPKHRPLPFSAA